MTAIERELRGLGADLAYPPTPELAALVAAQLAPRPGRSRPPLRRTLAITAVLMIVAGGAAVAAVPSLRHAVLDWLGVRSVRIEHVPTVPRLPTGPAGRGLGLGHRTTLSAARSHVRFRVLV